MKKKILIVTALFITIFAISSNQMFAQETSNKSNGTLEIIALYVPDFIVFKPAKGQKVKTYSVYLVSGTKSYRALKTSGLYLDVEMVDGEMKTTCTDKSELRAMNFDIPSTETFFKPQKIKFVADDKEMFYDLTKSAWD